MKAMTVAVIGAGRMGMRHCLGVLAVNDVKQLKVVDIREEALAKARTGLEAKVGDKHVEYLLWETFLKSTGAVDVIILASTAAGRLNACRELLALKPGFILLEKPLGQSFEEVNELVKLFDKSSGTIAFVNLNTRMYPAYKQLKLDLNRFPQFQGELSFSMNTGALGIGANGIHMIDLVAFLTDADKLELKSAFIDDRTIASGRGKEFADFGGYAVIEYTGPRPMSSAHIVMSPVSTVFGPWQIVGPHGRIMIDQQQQRRFDKLRDPNSTLPIQMYGGDYLPIAEREFPIPSLIDLTSEWLSELVKDRHTLPRLAESLKVHELMFKWLSHSNQFKAQFPIT